MTAHCQLDLKNKDKATDLWSGGQIRPHESQWSPLALTEGNYYLFLMAASMVLFRQKFSAFPTALSFSCMYIKFYLKLYLQQAFLQHFYPHANSAENGPDRKCSRHGRH